MLTNQNTVLKKGDKVKVFMSSCPGAKEHVGFKGRVIGITPRLDYLVSFNGVASWFYSLPQLRRAQ